MRASSTCLLVCLVASSAASAGLKVGDPAPKPAVGEFVKGEPFKEFAAGKVYLVEFWATWCGPCKESIPHLTKLQKKFPQAAIVGVAVWEEDWAVVKTFVQEMGDKMGYRVAVDDVAAGDKAENGVMSRTWLKAAGADGIPTAFLVNGQGRIEWIGHPTEADKPLSDVVAGRSLNEQRKKLQDFERKLAVAKAEAGLKLYDELLAAAPGLEAEVGARKFADLAAAGRNKEAGAYGHRLTDSVLAEDADQLHALAARVFGLDDSKTWPDESDEKPAAEVLEVAVAAAAKADKLADGSNPQFAITLAAALSARGDAVAAVAAMERAVRLAEADSDADEDDVDDLKSKLEQLRETAVKKAPRPGDLPKTR